MSVNPSLWCSTAPGWMKVNLSVIWHGRKGVQMVPAADSNGSRGLSAAPAAGWRLGRLDGRPKRFTWVHQQLWWSSISVRPFSTSKTKCGIPNDFNHVLNSNWISAKFRSNKMLQLSTFSSPFSRHFLSIHLLRCTEDLIRSPSNY